VTAVTAHVPVLLDEVLESLKLDSESVVVDATYGRGGHSRAMLARLGPTGRLLVMDRDPAAVADAMAQWGDDQRVMIRHGNFAELEATVTEAGLHGRVTALLADLGVSSPQLDDGERGFSFMADGPLDMRMDTTQGETAAAWLAKVAEDNLARVIRVHGEDKHARRIARGIVMARAEAPIERTGQLADIVAGLVRPDRAGHHPATRTFQAIRIHINDELGAIEQFLEQGIRVLSPGGRMAVISFHSLEDRRVKQCFAAHAKAPATNRRLPPSAEFVPSLRLVGGLIRPTETEIRQNPRSRSSRLRVAEKLGAAQ